MSKIRIGVLRGGVSSEHEVSLKTGKSVLSNLSEQYAGRDIFIDKNGQWYMDKKPVRHEQVFRSVDVIFNALHGEYGEDGRLQQILDAHGIPYTGSGAVASALGMNKILAREAFKRAGLNIPRGVEAYAENGALNEAKKAFRVISPPWVVKPVSGGSSVGVFVAITLPELISALEKSFSSGQKILIEEMIRGKEATCGIIDGFRNQKHYSLPVVEIVPPKKFGFFNYDAKYGGETEEICPARFDLPLKKEIERLAIVAHNSIGASHYSRSDFIVSKNGVYILEINTLPGLTGESLLPKAMIAVGSSHKELIDHLIKLALEK